MKTNITTDNYEAYLLDYMEGNLNADETEQLKAFVAAQGLDWNELTAPLPYLETPQIAYEGKEKLKKKAAVVPLYVKIASAAAAAGLLLTVSLWPEKSMPKVEPIAELKPILPGRLITASETTTTLPPRTVQFVQPQVVKKVFKKEKPTVSENVAEAISERAETPLVAQLEPQKAHILPTSTTFNEPDFDLLAYRMDTHLALAQIEANRFNLSIPLYVRKKGIEPVPLDLQECLDSWQENSAAMHGALEGVLSMLNGEEVSGDE